MSSGPFRPAAPWICLAAVLLGFLFYVARLHPVNYFAYFEDDSIYFSSAKALAEGRGYILPSFPGTPPATHYPESFPWLLSWVWRWRPSFPANLSLASSIVPVFAVWFLIAAFEFLRKRHGLGDWPALLIVTLCAFHPYFLYFSGQLMSDMPFLAAAFTAAMLADGALRRDGRIATGVAAGVLAGLSAGLRTVGLAVVAGIFAAGAYRRTWRQAGVSVLAAAPFLLVALGPLFAGVGSHPVQNSSPAEPGWTQTLAYSTSYLKFWRLCVPDLKTLFFMLWINVQDFVAQPGGYLVMPLLPRTVGGLTVAIVLTAAIYAGIVRQALAEDWKTIHFLFVFYAAIILPWNYPLMGRFLLLFLPLFYAGLWVEGKRFLALLGERLRSAGQLSDRIVAGALSLVVIALAVIAAWNYFGGFRPQLAEISARRAALLIEKREAYAWIREHADPQVPVVAYEDAALYLYTGRLSLRPIEFSTAGFYRRDVRIVERDLAHITDSARHVRARYWMMADDDFGLESMTPRPLLDPRIAELKSVLPVVFRSHGNRVQIYDLTCLLDPRRPECTAAVPVLFPTAGSD